MINKKIKTIAIVAIVAGFAVVGTGAIHAQTNNNKSSGFMSGIVSAIAQKFNLKVSDVQQVVDDQMAQQKTQMEANRQQSFTDRINKAVTDGKLTQDQANKIIAEKASVDAQISALNGKTGTELKSALKQIKDSVKQWATDNKIPQQYLMFGFEGRMGMGFGHMKK